jgi:arsenate reductase
MAEAILNHFSKGKALAMSAGTSPASEVDPIVIKLMQEIGIDISGNRPKMLTQEMIEQADEVITMACGVEGVCPVTFTETEDWGLEDPKGEPIEKVREIRDVIKERVIRLLEDMGIDL